MVLGIFFIKHLFLKIYYLFAGRKDQEKQFIRNFLGDNLTFFTHKEYEIIDRLANCTMCGLCSYENPILSDGDPKYFLRPYEISTLLSRSQPDYVYIDNLIKELYKYDWENVNCPYDVPYKEGLNLIISIS